MIVLCESAHDLPLVAVDVVVRTGPVSDPPGLEGLARHAVELMRRGAGARTRAQLDMALDALGASLDVTLTHDSVGFSARCLSRNLDAVLALLGDVIARPRLEDGEHERLRRETLALLDDLRDDDGSLCGRYFDRHALAGHPYGRTSVGTTASLTALQRDHAAAWIARHVVPDDLAIGFAGDVTKERAHALAERTFGALAAVGAPERVLLPELEPSPGRRTILVDKPERAQSQILVGHAAPRCAHPDYLPLHIAATAFGGTFSSRLMTEVRVKRGWSYGASFRLQPARAGHTFRLRVFPAAEQTPDTLVLVLSLWEDAVERGLTEEEIEFAKSYLAGSWAFEIDTPTERLERRVEALLWELPAGFHERYVERLRAVTPEAVNDAIRRWWRPHSAVTVLTATAATMEPQLAGLPLGDLQVVPYESY